MPQIYQGMEDKRFHLSLMYQRFNNPHFGPLMVYTNRARLIHVYGDENDDEAIEDYAFACLTANNVRAEWSIYFVSREYNLSDTTDHIAGRFIYGLSDATNHNIEIFALAEESALNLSAPGAHVEHLYLRSREERKAGELLSVRVFDYISRM